MNPLCAGGEVHKSTLALKPRVEITRSPKQGYQWSHKKDLCTPNFCKKYLVTDPAVGDKRYKIYVTAFESHLIYHPPTKLRRGNVLNHVCLSICPQAGPCAGPQLPQTCSNLFIAKRRLSTTGRLAFD